MQERRRHIRVAFDADAHLANETQEIQATIVDLSLKGALIRLDGDADLTFDPKFLRVRLPGSDESITMEVTLAHRQSGLIGLYCHHIDIDSVTHLRRLIELNVGDEALLMRELAELLPPES